MNDIQNAIAYTDADDFDDSVEYRIGFYIRNSNVRLKLSEDSFFELDELTLILSRTDLAIMLEEVVYVNIAGAQNLLAIQDRRVAELLTDKVFEVVNDFDRELDKRMEFSVPGIDIVVEPVDKYPTVFKFDPQELLDEAEVEAE